MKKKELKDLNLLDRFLFAEAVEDPETLQDMLEIILGKDVVLKHLPQTEKEERKSLWTKQIRMDVWAMDEENVIYDTEVQQRNTYNLPKRSRLYHGLIDSKLLKPGEIDYGKLNDVFVIMAMPFDLFGRGLYRYTFRMGCEEVPGLELNDGATRIFLNTHGADKTGVSDELIALLNYLEHTSQQAAEASGNEKIRRMHRKIETIRSSEEIGVKYMNEYEEKMLERQEGKKEAQKEMALKMKKKNKPLEEIAEFTGLSVEEIEAL